MNRFCSRALSVLLVAGLANVGTAHAYDPQTSQAGLVQKAALRGRLHHVLAKQLGRPLGLFEPIAWSPPHRSSEKGAALWPHLLTLDTAGGFRPEGGQASAIAWVAAGAALAETPGERGRHHFYNPQTRQGLADDPGATGFVHSLLVAADSDSGLRKIATATAFDLTGRPVLGWLLSPENQLSLPALIAALEETAMGGERSVRNAALARALLALGAITAALVDMGSPSHVRNDFRVAQTNYSEIGPWDQRPAYEVFVANAYGREGVPDPGEVVQRPTFESFFSAADGKGLADRTQRRFFSAGTVPPDVLIGPTTTTREVLDRVAETLAFPSPRVEKLDLRRGGIRRYLMVDGRRSLGYEREPGRVHFFLDENVYADSAAALLPEIGGYAAGLINHLLRAQLTLKAEGRQLQVRIEGLSGELQEGTLTLLSEDASGRRRPVGTPIGMVKTSSESALTVTVPDDVAKVAVCLRGRDQAGAFVAQNEILLP